MRHCILMTAYKSTSVPVINRFISHLPKDWAIYIHVDKKSDISISSIDSRAHVYSLFKIYWGGKEHLDAMLALLKEASHSSEVFDYYHILSGEDYWCCRPEDFDKYFSSPHSYLYIHRLPWNGWFRGGYELLQYKQLASFGDVRKGVMSWLNRAVKWTQKLLGIKQPLPNYPLFCNVVGWSLHRSAVEVVLNSEISADLERRMKNTLDSEELFFATVLMNSHIKESIINTPHRYVDWSSVPAPKVLGYDDLDTALASDAVFCRKVASVELASEIDRRLGL